VKGLEYIDLDMCVFVDNRSYYSMLNSLNLKCAFKEGFIYKGLLDQDVYILCCPLLVELLEVPEKIH